MKSMIACLALFVAVPLFAQAPTPDPRVGLEENFDTMDGWHKIDFEGETAPLKEMKSEGGVALFATHPAPLSTFKDRPKWLDGMVGYDPFTNVAKDYPEIDLDKYRYLVMKIDEMGCPTGVVINKVDVPVAYTTGIRAVDLSAYGLKGKQAIEFRIQFACTGAWAKVDGFRFVSRLTPEEQRGLIPPGYLVRVEGLKGSQTQGLDAVLRRVGRPKREALPGERLCFRDLATGALITRMTSSMDGASVVSDSVRDIFNANGSHMILLTGRWNSPNLYSFERDESTPNAFAGISRFSPRDPDILWGVEQKGATVRFHRINIRTGSDEVVGEATVEGEKGYSPVTDIGFAENTDQLAIGFRETPFVFVVDPSNPDPAKRVRAIRLPMRIKGIGLSPDGTRLFWNRCYWYESWEMNLESGERKLMFQAGGGHAGGGGGLRLGGGEGLFTAFPVGLNDWRPGDQIRILLNYRRNWATDYGHLSNDRQWYMANGVAGDMAGQIVMASTKDPGTVLRIAHLNTSRNDWSNNNVVKSSPDYTRVAWVSDLWGYNAVCVAYTRRPEPPRALSAGREGDAVALKWTRPMIAGAGRAPVETLGYNLYRSVNNGPFLALNRAVVRGETYRDEDVAPDRQYRYLVCAQEYSGLEGCPSNEAIVPQVLVDGLLPRWSYVHLEAEHASLAPPARAVFNGWTSAWRFVRVTKELETETIARVEWEIEPPAAGDFTLWLRVRAGDIPGKWRVSLGADPLGEVPVERIEWTWVKLARPVRLDAAKAKLALASADDGLAVDKILLTNNPACVPASLDDRFTVAPRKLEHLVATEATESSVRIAWWNPKAEPDVARYDVFVGETPDFPCDQAHLIASTPRGELLDWGLEPGRSYTYKVVPVNRRELAGEAASVTVATKPVQKVLLAFSIDQAKLDPRLVVETKGGKRYAYLPGKEEDTGDGPPADVTWDFNLPVAGTYVIWCQYAPADTYYTWMNVPTRLDDLLAGKATWRMRSPFRDMSGTRYRNWSEDLWFTDRVTLYAYPATLDTFRLAAGPHRLTLQMTPRMKEFHHKIAFLWITNDPSWRPPGWDPQADFTKSRVVRK